jgi:tetrahydromethanopterin S-methyltransferase subunit G
MDEWENWETVSIEAELDKLRDERENSATTATGATGAKVGCVSILLYFILGLVLFQIVGGLLSAFSK